MFHKSKRTPGRILAAFALIIAVLLPALGLGLYTQGAGAAAPPFKGLPNKAPLTPSTTLVISQVYDGGGAPTTSAYCYDYVELLNVSNAPVSLNGLSFQYGNANNMSGIFPLPNATVTAGGYYLIQTGTSTIGACAPLPTPDAIATVPVLTNGKVAIFNSTLLQSCGAAGTRCWPTNPLLIDMAGSGSASDYEGTAAMPVLSSTTAGLRKLSGCQDTDDNLTDFTVSSPSPRNSASAANPCGAVTATPTNTSVAATATSTPSTGAGLVISQVYGGGGNSGALYTHDFIEIFNPQSTAATITNWSVQYASAAGTTWQVSVLTGTITIQPGQYFLIREAPGAGGTQPLPTPDNIGSIPMSATAGKVALVNNSAALTGSCPLGGSIVDFVGFGTTASCFEGTGPAPAPSNTSSDLRAGGGCVDTNNNSADFSVINPPTPRNTSSPFNLCTAATATSTSTLVATITGTPPTATSTAIPPTATNTPLPPTATNTAVVGTIRIRDIQGITHISPLASQTVVNVPGVITGKATNGFFMQDPNPDANDDTSEGIFVFTVSAPPQNVGDSVLVSGTVVEFRTSSPGGLTLTEIGTPTIIVMSTGNPLPPAVVLGTGGRIPPNMIIEDDAGCGDVENCNTFDTGQDGVDFYESLEGMRVQVNSPVVVGPTNSFDETWVLGDNGAGASVRTYRGGIVIRANDFNPERIMVEPITGGSPNFNVNDTFSQTIVGVMSYGFSNYRVEATSALVPVSGGLTQEVAATAAPNELIVANFNVENLSPNDPPSKFTNLANLIVNNLKSPDLIIAEEIQDNNGTTNDGTVDASLTYNTLITAIITAGGPTYQYRQIDPVNNQDGGQPGGNIRQGFLFRIDRGFAFVDRPGGTSTNSNAVLNVGGVPQLLYSPGRINPTDPAWNSSRKPLAAEFTYNGRTLFIIGNHFNSKGGDDPLFGHNQPPIQSSQVQRNAQATLEANFVSQIFAIDSGALVTVGGDLNDYEFSSPLLILKAVGLNALVETLPQDRRYSYVFEGNSQDLDHIMTSNSLLAALTTYVPVHVNAEFSIQTSDHDPELARFNLPVGGGTSTPTRTSTAVPSATNTTVPSATVTRTNTVVPSATNTTVPSATVTQTNTVVPSVTNTTIPSVTNTTVPSATSTRTITLPVPSATSTNTVVPSVTPTRTATQTNVPTATRTNTVVPTATLTVAPSSTVPPTGTRTSTSTVVPTNTSTTVPSSTPTHTATNVPPTATSTVCPIQFADVLPDNTFYANIRCLACRGIINGYPCGGTGEPCNGNNAPYFRPGNLLSRGQLAKMVSQSAGFSEPVSGQSFEDVLLGTAFYTYTERLFTRGAIGGYQCGVDPNEPCGVGNKPYYRPGASITRGQLTKIVSIAAGFIDPAPATFTFTDVPVGSTFHIYVERLLINRPGVMNGYPCGGTGEPCDDQNRPYFRPGANLTRGQASKIVSNVFFPDCQTPAR